MRALVKTDPVIGMELREVPVPACGPNDALIRVHHAGVCGTGLHIWEWDSWASNRLKPPVVIGHEFAGRIEQIGGEAQAEGLLAIGDLLTPEGHVIFKGLTLYGVTDRKMCGCHHDAPLERPRFPRTGSHGRNDPGRRGRTRQLRRQWRPDQHSARWRADRGATSGREARGRCTTARRRRTC
jgi:hypothetical protein